MSETGSSQRGHPEPHSSTLGDYPRATDTTLVEPQGNQNPASKGSKKRKNKKKRNRHRATTTPAALPTSSAPVAVEDEAIDPEISNLIHAAAALFETNDAERFPLCGDPRSNWIEFDYRTNAARFHANNKESCALAYQLFKDFYGCETVYAMFPDPIHETPSDSREVAQDETKSSNEQPHLEQEAEA